MKLTDNVLRSFRVAKVFRENSDKINCFDFSSNGETVISSSDDDSIVLYDCQEGNSNGETVISSSDDDSIVLYDCQEGKPKRTLYSKKYGVDLIRYTHAANTVVYSSNKVDAKQVKKQLLGFVWIAVLQSLQKSSQIQAAVDAALRQGLMHLQGKPVCSFDPEGLIFAAGVNSEIVTLYDLRSFDKGPFATFKMMPDRTCEWTGLKFSNDGKLILVSTNGGTLRLLDAFKGVVLHSFMGYNNSKGSEDGKIHVWNAESGMKVAVLDGKHTGPVTCLQFNPKFMTFASGCSNMAFWLPTIDD
ncbi:UNVERIFIED_CONTAM: hypothetical protein FKN15_018001 [Acipenser sinensis]